MKGIVVGAIAVLVVVALVLGGATALAAKPQRAIELSNGFPSGQHFNLNIHGKKDGFVCNSTPGGRSVFIDEYGNATIEYVSNKKASMTELTVLDPCAVNGGIARVQLPYKIVTDEGTVPAEGYYVFARILGKKNNGKDGNASSIILYPNHVVAACNANESDTNFGNWTNCSEALYPLGVIVGTSLYIPDPEDPETFERFVPGVEKAKGKSRAVNITRLFTYTGWAVDASLDIGSLNETTSNCTDVKDGLITECDVPADACDQINGTVIFNGTTVYCSDFIDLDEGGDPLAIDLVEWLTFQSLLDPAKAWYFDGEWILNIADLVVTQQGLTNDGTKLLQIRFYPVATTEITPPTPS